MLFHHYVESRREPTLSLPDLYTYIERNRSSIPLARSGDDYLGFTSAVSNRFFIDRSLIHAYLIVVFDDRVLKDSHHISDRLSES